MESVLVAIIGAIALVASQWVASRHTRAIRRQLTPRTGRTLAQEVAAWRKETAAVATALGRLERHAEDTEIHLTKGEHHRAPQT